MFKLLLSQSHTKSPQAFWPAGGRWERLRGNEKKRILIGCSLSQNKEGFLQ